MSLINCAINFILTWFEDCVTSSTTEETNFAVIFLPIKLQHLQ